MSPIMTLSASDWQQHYITLQQQAAVAALEQGRVLFTESKIYVAIIGNRVFIAGFVGQRKKHQFRYPYREITRYAIGRRSLR
jgi:hypothetical protein